MPYIDSYKRDLLDNDLEKLILKLTANPKDIDYGSIEYVMFKILAAVAETKYRFTNLNALVGVLETTKMEFGDKFLKPYEEKKLLEAFLKKNKTQE